MTPGTHLNLHHTRSFKEFLESLALLTGAKIYHRLDDQCHKYQLDFPLEGWAALRLEVKWPANGLFLDLDIVVKSAVTDVSILNTRDEHIAKMFLTSIVQLYDPTPWGPAVGSDATAPGPDRQTSP